LKDAANDRERTNIQLALAFGYSLQDNFAGLLDVSSALVKQVPESRRPSSTTWRRSWGSTASTTPWRWPTSGSSCWKTTATPEHEDADRGQSRGLRGRPRLGRKTGGKGKENAELLNGIAWFALFTGKVEQDDIAKAFAQPRCKRTRRPFCTPGVPYAETGNTKEAHDLLLRAMDDWDLDEPNDEVWYVLGRIAEQYGERDIAIADYRSWRSRRKCLPFPHRRGGWRRRG